MGQSSFGGGSLNSALSHSSAARNLHAALCVSQCLCWHSAFGVAIFDLHTRLTCLETSAASLLLAALGAAVGRRHGTLSL